MTGELYQKNRDEEGLSQGVSDTFSSSTQGDQGVYERGLNCSNSPELITVYDRAPCEHVVSKKDSYIVLGRDRCASKASGWGGAGHTSAHMIDIVCGRYSGLKGNPSFSRDAARIYVSQKTNIDENFGCATGHVGLSEQRSGIGMMADDIRIIARQGVKIISQGRGTKNSLDVDIETTVGVDLIGGNQGNETDKDAVQDPSGLFPISKDVPTMQGIAKSTQTAYAMKNLVELVNNLAAILENFVLFQQSINTIVSAGMAANVSPPITGFVSIPLTIAGAAMMAPITSIGTLCQAPLKPFRSNTNSYTNNHLEAGAPYWIGSRFNYTN